MLDFVNKYAIHVGIGCLASFSEGLNKPYELLVWAVVLGWLLTLHDNVVKKE